MSIKKAPDQQHHKADTLTDNISCMVPKMIRLLGQSKADDTPTPADERLSVEFATILINIILILYQDGINLAGHII